MSGEVRFANENEASSCFSDSFVKVLVHSKAAFALLRKGCRHCWGRTPGGGEALRQAEEAEVRPFFRKSEHRSKTLVSLRQVPAEKQAVVVAFLTRIAEIRRGALRRVQERHLPPSLSTPYIYIYATPPPGPTSKPLLVPSRRRYDSTLNKSLVLRSLPCLRRHNTVRTKTIPRSIV